MSNVRCYRVRSDNDTSLTNYLLLINLIDSFSVMIQRVKWENEKLLQVIAWKRNKKQSTLYIMLFDNQSFCFLNENIIWFLFNQ